MNSKLNHVNTPDSTRVTLAEIEIKMTRSLS